MILTGAHVRLRPLERADAPGIAAWLHDPDTTRFMVLGRTAPSAEPWVAELMDGWPRLIARIILWDVEVPNVADRDLAVGVIGLWDLNWLSRTAELRIVLGHHRAKGLGTEATRLMLAYGFRALDLHRIWLGTAADNTAARRCFERCGFEQEGVLREDFLGPDGRRGDNVRYAILKPRWEALTYDAARAAERRE